MQDTGQLSQPLAHTKHLETLHVVGGVDNKVPQLHATQSEPFDWVTLDYTGLH